MCRAEQSFGGATATPDEVLVSSGGVEFKVRDKKARGPQD